MLHDETLPASPSVLSGVNPAREPQLDEFVILSGPAFDHLLGEIRQRIADALARLGAQRDATERALREQAMEAVEQWHPLRFDAAARDRRVRTARTAMNRAIEPLRTLLLLGDDPAIAKVLAQWPGLSEALRGIPDDDARTAWWFSLDARLKADDKEARRWFEGHRAECDAAAICAMHDAAEPEHPLLPPDDARACELVRCVQVMLSGATTIDAAGVVSIHPEHLVGNRLDLLLRVPLQLGELIERATRDSRIISRSQLNQAIDEEFERVFKKKKTSQNLISGHIKAAGLTGEKQLTWSDCQKLVACWPELNRHIVERAVSRVFAPDEQDR